MNCVTCGEAFTPQRGWKKRNPGLVGQCYDCGRATEEEREVSRHVGLSGGAGANKSGAIGIFFNPTKTIANLVRSINCGRFGAGNGMTLGAGPPERED